MAGKIIQQENKSRENIQKPNFKISDLSPNIEIITLHINFLNMPLIRQRLSEWIERCDKIICCL